MPWFANTKYMNNTGDTVILYAVDVPGPYPIHGRIVGRQADMPTAWDAKGRWSGSKNSASKSHELDLTDLVITD